jgi:Cft2 family RNA processing exonuclease
VDDFFDDGTVVEYFDDNNFEEFNETVFNNYNLELMGDNYLNDSNTSYQIRDEYYENNTRLRHLADSQPNVLNPEPYVHRFSWLLSMFHRWYLL